MLDPEVHIPEAAQEALMYELNAVHAGGNDYHWRLRQRILNRVAINQHLLSHWGGHWPKSITGRTCM